MVWNKQSVHVNYFSYHIFLVFFFFFACDLSVPQLWHPWWQGSWLGAPYLTQSSQFNTFQIAAHSICWISGRMNELLYDLPGASFGELQELSLSSWDMTRFNPLSHCSPGTHGYPEFTQFKPHEISYSLTSNLRFFFQSSQKISNKPLLNWTFLTSKWGEMIISPPGLVHIIQDAACKELAQFLTRHDSTDISCDTVIITMVTLLGCHPRKY